MIKPTQSKRFKFATTTVWLVFIASTALIVYTVWRSEVIWHGSSRHLYTKYYLIAICGLIFSAITFRLRDSVRLNVVMVVAAVMATLYTIELCLFLTEWRLPTPRHIEAAQNNIPYDKRTRLQVVKQLQENGIDAVPSVGHQQVEFSVNDEKLISLSGISKKTTVRCNEGGYFSIYPSDRFGFNNPDREWDHSHISGLLLGDSFTQGSCVKPNEDITGQLRHITGKAFLNLGMAHAGPLLEFARLVEYGIDKKPKYIFWMYFEQNDFRDLIGEMGNPRLVQYLSKGFSQNLAEHQNAIDKALLKHVEREKSKRSSKGYLKKNLRYYLELGGIRYLLGINKITGQDKDRTRTNYQEELEGLQEILRKAKTIAGTWGGTIYFVYLPSFQRYDTEYPDYRRFIQWRDEERALVFDAVNKLSISIIDIDETVFANQTNPLELFPFGMNGHYNAEGYKLIAETIVEHATF